MTNNLTFLVPSDFSECANQALDFAVELAKVVNAEILLFHSYNVPVSASTMMIDISETIEKECEENLRSEIKRVEKKYEFENISSTYDVGPIVGLIQRTAITNSVDLIIMGTEGANGLEGALFGSKTSNLIQSTKCPVLSIPKGVKQSTLKNFLFACDLSQHQCFRSMKLLETLQKAQNATIDLLHIATDETHKIVEENLYPIQQHFSSSNVHILSRPNGIIDEEIEKFVKKSPPDLLIVIAREYPFWDRLFHKSITAKLVKQLTIPILLFHEHVN